MLKPSCGGAAFLLAVDRLAALDATSAGGGRAAREQVVDGGQPLWMHP